MEEGVQVIVLVVLSIVLFSLGYLVRQRQESAKPTITDAGIWTLTDRLKDAASLAETAVTKAELAADKADVAVDVARDTSRLIESFVPILQHITVVVEEGAATTGRVETAASNARDLAAGVAVDLAATKPPRSPRKKRPTQGAS